MHDLERYFDGENDEEEQIDGGLLLEMAQLKEMYYKVQLGFANVDKLSIINIELYRLSLVAIGMF